MTVRPDVVAELDRLLAEEAEAALRYLQLRFRLRGEGADAVAALLADAQRETMEHAEALAAEIRALGFTPGLRVGFTPSAGWITPADALIEALDVEQAALDGYRELAARISDPPRLSAFLQAQVEVEDAHVQALRDLMAR